MTPSFSNCSLGVINSLLLGYEEHRLKAVSDLQPSQTNNTQAFNKLPVVNQLTCTTTSSTPAHTSNFQPIQTIGNSSIQGDAGSSNLQQSCGNFLQEVFGSAGSSFYQTTSTSPFGLVIIPNVDVSPNLLYLPSVSLPISSGSQAITRGQYVVGSGVNFNINPHILHSSFIYGRC